MTVDRVLVVCNRCGYAKLLDLDKNDPEQVERAQLQLAQRGWQPWNRGWLCRGCAEADGVPHA